MDETIHIKKLQQQPKSEEIIARNQLKSIGEFTKDEQVGILRIQLNELIRDKLIIELIHRKNLKESDMARGKERTDIAMAELTKSGKLLNNLDDRIKETRQLIQEVDDGRFVI